MKAGICWACIVFTRYTDANTHPTHIHTCLVWNSKRHSPVCVQVGTHLSCSQSHSRAEWLHSCIWWCMFCSLACSLQISRQHAADSTGNTIKPPQHTEKSAQQTHMWDTEDINFKTDSPPEPYNPNLLINEEEVGMVDGETAVAVLQVQQSCREQWGDGSLNEPSLFKCQNVLCARLVRDDTLNSTHASSLNYKLP